MVHSDRIGDPIEPWPLGMFDCCTFRSSHTDRKLFYPDFFPYALCCTCFLVGKIRTHEKRERSIYCGMGITGINACLKSAPCCCCFYVEPMRAQVVLDYDLIDKERPSPLCNQICFPCSLFQVLYSRIDLQKRARASTIDTEARENMTLSPFCFENSEKRMPPPPKPPKNMIARASATRPVSYPVRKGGKFIHSDDIVSYSDTARL
mmetsp:Transcript_18769/g.18090  ORF Transcript_18769/g.18090 Transcript_18769/m.18090 type:complete len:206 (+) Transcript_18769:143-760(+)